MTESKKALRHRFGAMGWTLLVYSGIMNLGVLAVCLMDVGLQLSRTPLESMDQLVQLLSESLLSNGWGYALTIAVGLGILWLWKGKRFCLETIWTRNAPMRAGDFWGLLCVFTSCQLAFQVIAIALESYLNLLGFTALGAMESATQVEDTFSMFLYAGILAPITEEILFRGLILRTLLPQGKQFAIVMSAFLFGIFHGNIVQSPYAFLVGLVLGYTAVEYSVAWAMVLHMFNNMMLSQVMTRLTAFLPWMLPELLSWLVILGFSLAGGILLLLRRKEVAAYFRANRMDGAAAGCFFTSPGILVLIVYMALNMIMTIQPL